MQILIFPIKNSLFTNKLIVQPFPAVAVSAGAFCCLIWIDPAQIVNTRIIKVIGAGAAETESRFLGNIFDQSDANCQCVINAAQYRKFP